MREPGIGAEVWGRSSASESLEQSLWARARQRTGEKKIKNRESGVIEVEGGELEGGLGAKEGEKFEKKQRGEATQAQREKRRFVFARV